MPTLPPAIRPPSRAVHRPLDHYQHGPIPLAAPLASTWLWHSLNNWRGPGDWNWDWEWDWGFWRAWESCDIESEQISAQAVVVREIGEIWPNRGGPGATGLAQQCRKVCCLGNWPWQAGEEGIHWRRGTGVHKFAGPRNKALMGMPRQPAHSNGTKREIHSGIPQVRPANNWELSPGQRAYQKRPSKQTSPSLTCPDDHRICLSRAPHTYIYVDTHIERDPAGLFVA